MVYLLHDTAVQSGQGWGTAVHTHNICCYRTIDIAETNGHAQSHASLIRTLDVACEPSNRVGCING